MNDNINMKLYSYLGGTVMKKQKKIIGFIALAIAMFMGTLDSTIINIALPDIQAYFKASLNDTSWISTIYVLGLSIFMIPASKLADQFGRKKVMLFGLVLFGGSSALCGSAGSLFFLISMRLIQGIGGAIITPIVIPMAIELFGKEKTQTVAGMIGAITALAAAGGPPLGGILIKYINWQSIFYVNVPFAVLSFLLTLFFVGESYDDTVSKKIDWIGMLLLTSTLFLLTFALLEGRNYGWSSATIVSMFVGSGVSLILFLLAESKVSAPLVELTLFKEHTFTASSVCYLITGFGIVAPLLIFNYFLQNALGYEALSASYVVMAVSLTVIVAMPLGSVISGKAGARPVNFLGVLIMGIGVFLLSRVSFDTPKSFMILDMVVCGFGLGFSCQSLVSSIQYLPAEKSGIGSGIVNSARQIGTCIGIALLVSVLNTNASNAKTEIRNQAVSSVQSAKIADSVKTVMIRDINQNFDDSGTDDSTYANQQRLQDKTESDVKTALTSNNLEQKPASETLRKLYDGVNTLISGSSRAVDGQQTLSGGIRKLASGLTTLQNGNKTLLNGIGVFQNNLSQVTSGAQTLNKESSAGIPALTAGIGQLDSGTQRLYSQFLPGGKANTKTVYDGITGISDGAQNLSSNLNRYVSSVNSTYYLMIKSNPASAKLLAGYQKSLAQAQAAYSHAQSKAAKEQLGLQVRALGSLVTLYTAGTDPSVQTEQQFEAKLFTMAQQSENQNIISTGKKVTAGARQLAGASKAVSAQFQDGGAFRNGMKTVANGTSSLNQNSKKLSLLQAGTGKLADALTKLNQASNQLLAGSQNLGHGIETAKAGSNGLLEGSKHLSDADTKIKEGAGHLASGISTAGQAVEIKDLVSQVKSDKNDKIAGAFDQTFLLAAIILCITSVCGLFTDKKRTTKPV